MTKYELCVFQSFLEELAASQEKALKMSATAQQESIKQQREAAEQKEQYESVIIELQAQVSVLKNKNKTKFRDLYNLYSAYPVLQSI
jgi:hypothetical protein